MRNLINSIKQAIFSIFFSSQLAKGLSKSQQRDFIMVGVEWAKEKEKVFNEEEARSYCRKHFDEEYNERLKPINEERKLEKIILKGIKKNLSKSYKQQIDEQMAEIEDEIQAKLQAERDHHHKHDLNVEAEEQEQNRLIGQKAESELILGYKPTFRGFIDNKLSMTGLSIAFAGLEVTTAIDAFRYTGFSEHLVWPMSISVPLVGALSGHIAGFCFSKGSSLMKGISTGFLLIGSTCIGTIAYYRGQKVVQETPEVVQESTFHYATQVQETVSTSSQHNIGITIIMIVLLMLIVLISYLHYSRRQYWLIKRWYKESEERESVSQIEVNDSPFKIASIEKEGNAEAKRKAKKVKEDLQKEEEKSKTKIAGLKNKIKHIEKQHIVKSEQAFKCIKKGFSSTRNFVSRKRGRRGFNTIIVILLSLLATSCNYSTATTEYTYFRDISESMLYAYRHSAEEAYNYFVRELDLDQSEPTFDGIIIRLCPLASTSTNEIIRVELKSVSSFIERNFSKRKTEIKRFKQQLKAALVKIYAKSFDAQKTNLNRALSYHLSTLAQSKADNKKIILDSDMILDGAIMNFKKIGADDLSSSFLLLSDSLQKDSPLPLDGQDISVEVIYRTSDIKKDRLSYAAIKFWKKHFKRADISVSHSPDFD